ncbi:hypothetical protein QQS21_007779 [Conoideocrella luteorostrata]|uniref:Uncharacterized protein n=1 Tax=Conoideocrella luteorostrata TaxID=1105319 RepID=A0AAJ0CMF2_9HYPO|nr:hypothetical protein QQS21_007779 [Conoideocrella luteorostrata]
MDKGSLLTASKVEPGVSLNPHSTIISHLAPTLAFVLRFQYLLRSFSSFVYLHASSLTGIALVNALYASQFLVIHAYIAAKFGIFQGLKMSAKAASGVWEAKTTQALRKKLFYEFAVFILGSGNFIILMMLWPGWLVVGGLLFTLWRYYV